MRFLHALLSLAVLFPAVLAAQERVSESQVMLQQIFIEANREKLLGNYDKAITRYNDVMKEDPRNHAAAYELARIYDLRSDWDEAVRYLKIAVDNDADNEWYQKLLADVYQKAGRNKEAASVYETLVQKAPGNEYYYYKWAFFLVKAGDVNRAIQVYENLEARTGINEEIARRKHALFIGTGDTKKATAELVRLVDAFPKNTSYRHLLAGYYEQLGDRNSAMQVYRDILAISPSDPKANLAIAGADVKESDDNEYLASLKPAFEQADVEIDLKMGKLLPIITKVVQTGSPTLADAALELTDILERVHPTQAKVFAAAGDLLYHSGRHSNALVKYQRTLQLDKSVYLVWEQLMRIHLESRDFTSLARISEQAIDLFPNKAFVYYMNGLAARKNGQMNEAADVLDQAFLMAANDNNLKLDILVQLGLAHYALLNYEEGDNAFEAALKINPQSAQVLSLYSICLAGRADKLGKAATLAKSAQEIAPNQSLTQHAQGWVLFQQKSYAEARQWLDKALPGAPNDPMLLEHYGDLLFQQNDTSGALQYWIKSRDSGNRTDSLDKKIKLVTGQ
jgi:tetratricopeptide (TPR) repeat protein